MNRIRRREFAMHHRSIARVLVVALSASAATAAWALTQPKYVGNVEQGERIAKHWCASCHMAAPGQKQASADVAPFVDVARTKTDKELAAFLTDPHPKMPDMHLSRHEIADLVAYIRSLAPNGPAKAK
jgi:mono/diheme cytochrome c family protein